MRVRDTILAATAEVGIDENWCLLENKSALHAFIMANICKTSDMLMMNNIYVYTAT